MSLRYRMSHKTFLCPIKTFHLSKKDKQDKQLLRICFTGRWNVFLGHPICFFQFWRWTSAWSVFLQLNDTSTSVCWIRPEAEHLSRETICNPQVRAPTTELQLLRRFSGCVRQNYFGYWMLQSYFVIAHPPKTFSLNLVCWLGKSFVFVPFVLYSLKISLLMIFDIKYKNSHSFKNVITRVRCIINWIAVESHCGPLQWWIKRK